MYTRCPSCRAEISFEPPVHADSLPDGYKHKIKCPSCGVTIGVKIPRHEVAVQPTFVPQNPNAVAPEENYNAPIYAEDTPATDDVAAPAKAKKKGFGRAASAFAMIWALLLVGFFVVAYLVTKEIIPAHDILAGIGQYDAISYIIELCEPDAFKLQWELLGADMIWLFMPAVTLLFAFIHFIVSFSCLCAGKYSKAYNVVWTLLIFAGAALSLLYPALSMVTTLDAPFADTLKDAFVGESGYVTLKQWLTLVAVPALGFVSFLTALCSLGVKNPNKQPKGEEIAE